VQDNIQSSEVVLWSGLTTVPDAVNGRYCTATVTKDRDWVWIRFSSQPSETYRRELGSLGYTWSKKRKAWHALISEPVVYKLNKWGAHTLTYQQLQSAMPERKPEVAKITGNLSIEEPSIKIASLPAKQEEPKAKAKTSSSKELELAKIQLELEKSRTENLKLQLELARLQAQQVSTPKVDASHHLNGNGHYKVAGINLG
jgi:hypothetical protein